MSVSSFATKELHTPRRRRLLLLSGAALLGALSGYGRSAYAQVAGGLCTDTIASGLVTCTGSSTAAQSINQNVGSATGGLAVSVTPAPLQVDTAAGNALTITGYGAVSFTDSYGASYLDSNDAGGSTALAITSSGTATPGSVTVETSGTLNGNLRGIDAVNEGDGATSITIAGNGEVTSVLALTSIGINARNGTALAPAGTTLTVITGAGTEVRGAQHGIRAANYGSGLLTVEANGKVFGTNPASAGRGISTYSLAGANITTAAGSVTQGYQQGIAATDRGSGTLTIEANGTVLGTDSSALSADKTGGRLNITTGAGSMLRGGPSGIFAEIDAGASTEITVHGEVTAAEAGGRGINVGTRAGSLSAKVTTRAGSTVKGGQTGIRVGSIGSGDVTAEANGTVIGEARDGIFLRNAGGGRITATTGTGSTVMGGERGIVVIERNGETMTIEANGTVTGGADDGIFAQQEAGGAINITIGATSTVTSNGVNADDFAIETLGGTSNVTVAGILNNGGGGGVQFDPGAFNDRLELHPTAQINGTVLAGLGTDTLAFGGAGDGTFDLGTIDDGGGAGLQYQSFEAFQVESGTWTFSGGTTADFTVNGGTVMGTGTFGDLTLNGGTIAPGNSIGTMTVNGAFTLGSGAVFEVEANAAGQSDKVIVNGTVNLTGATLRVLAETGFYALRTNYVIIENDGTDTVVGTFANVTSNLAFLIPTVIYDGGTGNDVVLTLERDDSALVEVAVTENQTSVAKVFVNCNIEDPLCVAVLTQTATGARQAFNTLSGEIHATVAGTLSDDSRYVREAVLGRLMQASHMGEALSAGGPQVAPVFDGKSLVPLAPERAPLAFWTQGYGAWGDFDSDSNAASADRDLGGFISGMDAGIGGSWRAGLATGASFSNVDVSGRYSSADVSTYHLGGYIGGMAGAFALRGGGMWGWSDIETSRAVVFPNFYERQKANYDADTGQIFGEIAYPTQMGGIALEPFGGLAFVSVDVDSFTERGGPEASLRGRNLDQDVGYTSLGLRAATTTMWGATQVTPHISAAWLHAFDDVTPDAALAFASTGIGFAIDGVPLAEDSALLDAGLDFAVSDRLSAGVSYTGQFGDGVTDNGIRGRLTWLFN